MNKAFIVILSAIMLCIGSARADYVTYTADNTTIFPNPERGFTDEIEDDITDNNPSLLVGNEDYFDEEGERQSQRLVVLVYYIGYYKDKALSETMLNGFDADMQVLRDKGFKCVLRFAYCESNREDADLEHVKLHLSQLRPHLHANADVIYVVEAGFVGRWGEWYYTLHFINKSQHLNADRRVVIDSLLSAVPANRFVLVRYPLIKIEYQGHENAVTSQQAYGNTPRARIGHHNDAFLNDWGDEGTYSRDDDQINDDPVLRQYIADETLFVPNGGETNIEDDTWADSHASYQQTTQAMARYHWSFCGSEYAPETTDKWRDEGTFDELNRRMGYRYQLVNATLPDNIEQGGTAGITLNIRNTGYAPLYNERHVYIVLKNNSGTYPVMLQTDPRRWLPNDAVTTISEQITLPTDIPAGTYQLYLHMPDAYASLAADPRFAVRFANNGVWDAATGMNSLNATVTVSELTSSLGIVVSDRTISGIKGMKIFSITGSDVTALNGTLPQGVYIVRQDNKVEKVIIK